MEHTYRPRYCYDFEPIVEKLSGAYYYLDGDAYTEAARFDSGKDILRMGYDIDTAGGTDNILLDEGDNAFRFNIAGEECGIHVKVVPDGDAVEPYVTDLWVYLAQIRQGEELFEEPSFNAVLHDSTGEHIIGNHDAEIYLDGLVIDDLDTVSTLTYGMHTLKAHFLGAEGDLRLNVRYPLPTNKPVDE